MTQPRDRLVDEILVAELPAARELGEMLSGFGIDEVFVEDLSEPAPGDRAYARQEGRYSASYATLAVLDVQYRKYFTAETAAHEIEELRRHGRALAAGSEPAPFDVRLDCVLERDGAVAVYATFLLGDAAVVFSLTRYAPLVDRERDAIVQLARAYHERVRASLGMEVRPTSPRS